MADYSNIKRIVIRKPVSLKDFIKAFKILQELNRQIDVIRFMGEKQVIPKIIFDHMMINIDAGIERTAQLSGFASMDDMKYYIENFKDL